MPLTEQERAALSFARDANGVEITRQRTCECGRRFSQNLLSAQFLAIAERQSRHAIDAITRQIPDYFVPVHCPPCESRDLGMQSRKDEYKHGPQQPYGEAAD